jgi:ferrous iron transport protein B
MKQKVANYPGVTVERKSGRLAGHAGIEVIDLPGTYSLNPKSIDERVAYDVLVGRMDGEDPPDVVVCVVDATNLERNLYLVSQILDLGLPVVVALNMMDAAAESGMEIDIETLSDELGVPVVPLVARKGRGTEALRAAIFNAAESASNGQAPSSADPAPARQWPLQSAVERPVEALADQLAEEAPDVPPRQRRFEALGALTSDPLLTVWEDRAPAFYQAVLQARERLSERNVPYQHAETLGRYQWISPLARTVVTTVNDASERTLSDKIDAVLTHRIAGPAIFGAILLLVFQAVFTWAVPAMNFIEAAVGWTGQTTRAVMPNGLVEDLLVEGVIAGVGNVIVFLPQILLLFFFLGLMEDTGYMARTAFIMDRLMRRMGLSGGSVVPLLSSYACAVPGIMAARTLDSERDRIITIMVAPLMSCSARLPVYTLFIAAFIPAGSFVGVIGYQGLAMFALYLLGTVMAFVAAWILKTFVFTGDASMFVMELPPYRLPQGKHLLQRMWGRVRLFAVRAGKIILGASVLLWILASFPTAEPDPERQAQRQAVQTQYQATIDSVAAARNVSPEQVVAGDLPGSVVEAKARRDAKLAVLSTAAASAQARQSFIGRFSRTIEPVMQPLGFDWKITAGIVSAIAAREVIISALSTIYSVGGGQETVLREALQADTYPNGDPVYTPLVAVSLMVFFVFALQCMSTLAVAKRELNSWFWPSVMWLYMFALAYVFSLAIYQGGQMLGVGG